MKRSRHSKAQSNAISKAYSKRNQAEAEAYLKSISRYEELKKSNYQSITRYANMIKRGLK
jgi:hypothetical protein